jgi:hypothetical protein
MALRVFGNDKLPALIILTIRFGGLEDAAVLKTRLRSGLLNALIAAQSKVNGFTAVGLLLQRVQLLLLQGL